jgi:hypothetical protein
LRWKAMPRMPSGSSTKPNFLYSPTTCSSEAASDQTTSSQ